MESHGTTVGTAIGPADGTTVGAAIGPADGTTVGAAIGPADGTTVGAAAARHARFGKLPERVRFEDMVQEQRAGAKSPAGDGYSPEGSWISYSCLALDLGL